MARKLEKVKAGSGDVFVALGFADAGERKLRVQLAVRINELIAGRKLTQAKTAAVFGVPQPSLIGNWKGQTHRSPGKDSDAWYDLSRCDSKSNSYSVIGMSDWICRPR